MCVGLKLTSSHINAFLFELVGRLYDTLIRSYILADCNENFVSALFFSLRVDPFSSQLKQEATLTLKTRNYMYIFS